MAEGMEEAVAINRSLAVPGDVVLLSKAASCRMYSNFAGGGPFRRLVQEFLQED